MQLKLSFYDWCISILSSKKCQTPIILAELLWNESLLRRVQRVIVCDLWLVDFDPFCEFLCFKVRFLWSYCDQNPTLIFQIFLINKPFPLLSLGHAQIIKGEKYNETREIQKNFAFNKYLVNLWTQPSHKKMFLLLFVPRVLFLLGPP